MAKRDSDLGRPGRLVGRTRQATGDECLDVGVCWWSPSTLAVHNVGYYRERYGTRPEDFPRALDSEGQSLSLPLFPGLTDAEQDHVIQTLCRMLG